MVAEATMKIEKTNTPRMRRRTVLVLGFRKRSSEAKDGKEKERPALRLVLRGLRGAGLDVRATGLLARLLLLRLDRLELLPIQLPFWVYFNPLHYSKDCRFFKTGIMW